MYKFKCPVCGRRCEFIQKLSEVKNKPEEKRVYQWECNGQSPKAAHPPMIFKVQALRIMRDDKFGKIITKTDRVTMLWIEDSDLHDLLDEWKAWMGAQQYKNLKKEEPAIA